MIVLLRPGIDSCQSNDYYQMFTLLHPPSASSSFVVLAGTFTVMIEGQGGEGGGSTSRKIPRSYKILSKDNFHNNSFSSVVVALKDPLLLWHTVVNKNTSVKTNSMQEPQKKILRWYHFRKWWLGSVYWDNIFFWYLLYQYDQKLYKHI